ncbi:hypothetical protein QQZ08_003046 [Neonectria magnoliae]|uniref:Uncharacterized protein n=1 Tax=Neonectria magnoliae TaxID=2732573 RepID=A0ABR1I9L8_9HYPO
MPCCIAIIQFAQCRHSTLFKLGCTAHCDSLCPVPDQRALVITRYLWSCEDCHLRRWTASEDARSAAWTARIDAAASEASALPADTRRQLVDTLTLREQHEEHRLEAARLLQVEEIQWVAEWTLEYGLMVWDVCCQRSWEPRAAARRVKQLRALRLWDLVVTQDALRGRKELRREQTPRSLYQIATGQSGTSRACEVDADGDMQGLGNRDSQRKALTGTQTPTPAIRPPPVFLAEDINMGGTPDENQEEIKQESEDEDESGDVIMTGLHSSPVLGPLEEPSLAMRSRHQDDIPLDRYE